MDRPERWRGTIGRLHVIISESLGGVTGSRPRFTSLELAAAALRGGADTIQYRRKRGDYGGWLEEARGVAELCRAFGVPLIINDHLQLCLDACADGLHLGLTDMPVAEARRILGPEKIIGGTARTIEHIRAAAADGADYVGFGPVWATGSKSIDDPVRGIDHLRAVAHESPIPVIAIGGINIERAARAIEAGAHGVAVIGVVAGAEDPEGVVRGLWGAIENSHS